MFIIVIIIIIIIIIIINSLITNTLKISILIGYEKRTHWPGYRMRIDPKWTVHQVNKVALIHTLPAADHKW